MVKASIASGATEHCLPVHTDTLTPVMGRGGTFRWTSVWELALLFTGYVTLGDLLNTCMLRFPHL